MRDVIHHVTISSFGKCGGHGKVVKANVSYQNDPAICDLDTSTDLYNLKEPGEYLIDESSLELQQDLKMIASVYSDTQISGNHLLDICSTATPNG
jgi:hypothetical protein